MSTIRTPPEHLGENSSLIPSMLVASQGPLACGCIVANYLPLTQVVTGEKTSYPYHQHSGGRAEAPEFVVILDYNKLEAS